MKLGGGSFIDFVPGLPALFLQTRVMDRAAPRQIDEIADQLYSSSSQPRAAVSLRVDEQTVIFIFGTSV